MKKGEDFTGLTVVYSCHDGEGNYVLAKRSKNCRDEHERWDIGGGAVEHTQPVLEALYNEIKEEYCTDVLDVEFLGYRDVHREKDGVKTHWVALDFKVHVDKDKVAIGEPHKFDDIGWFKITEIPKNIHSQLPVFLENYKDKL